MIANLAAPFHPSPTADDAAAEIGARAKSLLSGADAAEELLLLAK